MTGIIFLYSCISFNHGFACTPTHVSLHGTVTILVLLHPYAL